MKPSTKRIAWIDIARGIGIVLVVYGHVLRGLVSANILQSTNPIWACDYTIYTFHMPLFFVLAGLQVDRSLAKGANHFLRNKLQTIAYPYILWSLFQGTVQLLIPGFLNSPRSPWTLATILWRPTAQFWFLYILFFCHVLAYLSLARRRLLIPITIGSLVCAILTANGVSNRLMAPAALVHWFVFYALGILFSHSLLGWRPRSAIVVFWSTGTAATFGLFSHIGRVLSNSRPDAPASWPASITGIALIICLSQLLLQTDGLLSKWGEVLGRSSLTIYIFHVLAAAGTRVALKKLGVGAWAPQLIAGTLVGVCAPLLLHVWLERADLLAITGLGARRKEPQQDSPTLATV